jgi:hypothetical protein
MAILPPIKLNPWIGLIGGLIVVLILALTTMILSVTIISAALLFAGGLTAGLLNRGSLMRGAILGALIGAVVAMAGTTWMVLYSRGPVEGYYPVWDNLGVIIVIMAVLFVPSNTVSGIIGSILRGWYEGIDAKEGMRDSIKNRRMQWIGIITGAIVIAVSLFLTGLNLLLYIPLLLVAGLIAGYRSEGGIRAGLESGLITVVLGIGILAVPILWIASQGTGFAAGLGGVVLIIVAVIAVPTVILGGVIGALIKKEVST